MKRLMLVGLLTLLLLPSLTVAGPNANGTLVLHNTGLSYTWGIDPNYPSPPPEDCDAVNSVMGPAMYRIYKVYAMFPKGSSPRLKTARFQMGWPMYTINMSGAGLPEPDYDSEVTEGGWPNTPGASVTVTFGTTKTDLVTEVHWFAFVALGSESRFWVAPHITLPSVFIDDASEPHEDAIAGFSSLGYGAPGVTTCPGPGPDDGACCLQSGDCLYLTVAECTAQGGFFQGLGLWCYPSPCTQLTGACCFPDGHCETLLSTQCAPGDWRMQMPCEPLPCPQPSGACCFVDGTCEQTQQAECPTTDWRMLELCAGDPCPQPSGACCFPDGHCETSLLAQCPTGSWTMFSTCSPNPCPQPGACCFADGHCELLQHPDCEAQWHGTGSGCEPSPCPQPGACCMGTYCVVLFASDCANYLGSFEGNNTNCVPNPCPTSGLGDGHLATTVNLRADSNPFISSTTLHLAGPPSTSVRLLVFDPTGRLVRSLWEGTLDGRDHSIPWDGRDDNGHQVPAGVYVVRAHSAHGEALVRLVKMK